MKTTFSKDAIAEPATATVADRKNAIDVADIAEKDANLPAERSDTAVAKNADFALGGVSGDIGEVKLSIPRIQIVQGTGDLTNDFPAGAVVFDKEVMVAPPASPVTEWTSGVPVTILSARLQFKENLDFDSDELPTIVDTVDEVIAQGGHLDGRKDSTGNYVAPAWIPFMTVLTLIEAEDGSPAGDLFSEMTPNDTKADMALWYLQKSAFSKAGKDILTAGKYRLKNRETGLPELHKGKFLLQVRREKLGSFNVFVPRLKQVGRHTDEFVQYAESLIP